MDNETYFASMAIATPKIEPAYISDCAMYQSTLPVTSRDYI